MRNFLLPFLVVVPSCLCLADDIRVVKFPKVMSDFAINPHNGDIAAVSAQENRAYLFAEASLEQAKAKSSGDVRVGETPVAIAFKQFGERRMFAVVCSQDSHMYIMDASSFKPLEKIPLQGAGVSNVFSSANPDDPFVYYNFGSGHDSAMGAVDVRKMVDRAKRFGDSMDGAISADGSIAYRRGPWSPSGFDSLKMSNTFDAEKPTFVSVHDEHRSTGAYYPGPFGNYTASSGGIYSADLRRQVASVKMVPVCFFRKHPLVIGLVYKDRYSSRSTALPKLAAASYNTFSSTGKQLTLPAIMSGTKESLPRGVRGQADFKRVGLRQRVLPDDTNARVVFGFRDQIALIPLTEFEAAEEPFLQASVSQTELPVDTKATIQVAAMDPRVKVSYGDLPDGAQKTATGFTWLPGGDQIGDTKVSLTLSFGEIQRVQDIVLKVSRPSISLPFSMAGLAIDDNAEQAVCWSTTANQRNGVQPKNHVAVVSLKSKDVQSSTVDYQIRQLLVFNERFAALPIAENSRVEIFDKKTAKRVRTLIAGSPVTSISKYANRLFLHTGNSIDIYDITTLKKMRTINRETNRGRSGVAGTPMDGVLVSGVLFDHVVEKPRLLIDPTSLYQVFSDTRRATSTSFLRYAKPVQNQFVRSSMRQQGGLTRVAGPTAIPVRGVTVRMDRRTTQIRRSGRSSGSDWKHEVSLQITDADGQLAKHVPIIREMRTSTGATPYHGMKVKDSTVYVGVGDRLFAWSAAEFPEEKEETTTDFHFVPTQSTFVVDAPTVELKHELKGGKGPYEYFWLAQIDGVKFDEKSGVATVDRGQLLKAVEQRIIEKAASSGRMSTASDQIRDSIAGSVEKVRSVLGRAPNGIPVPIPIRLKAIDSTGKTADLQYSVILEVDARKVSKTLALKTMEAERQRVKMQAEAASAKLAIGAAGKPATNRAGLEKRVESLEAKIDLLIRQMSEMAKELDKQKRGN